MTKVCDKITVSQNLRPSQNVQEICCMELLTEVLRQFLDRYRELVPLIPVFFYSVPSLRPAAISAKTGPSLSECHKVSFLDYSPEKDSLAEDDITT
jgi:hypothetical protein